MRLLFLFLFLVVLIPVTAQVASPSISVQDSMLQSHVLSLESNPMLSVTKTKEILSVKLRESDNRTLEFFIALLVLLILGLLKQMFPQYLENLFSVFNVFGASRKAQKGQLENDSKASLGFYVVYLINLAFVSFTAVRLFIPEGRYTTLSMIGIASLSVLVVVGVKSLLTAFVAWIFKQDDLAKVYRFNNSIVNEFTGMFLLPVSLLLLLTQGKVHHILATIALLILAISLIFKYLRNSSLIISLLRIDFLHFLLYLCAFEIVPIVVLLKMVVGH